MQETDAIQTRFDELCMRIRGNDPELTSADMGFMTVTWSRVQMHAGLGSDGCARFAESLMCNTHVSSIDLSGNAIGDRGAQRLARVLTRPTNVITTVNLSGNGLTDVAGFWLSVALKSAPCLVDLDLSYNALGDSGVSSS